MRFDILEFAGNVLVSQFDQSAGGNIFVQLMPFVLIFAIFYFLMILPQKKQQKKHQQMLNSLQKGDNVLLSNGIYGRISEFKDQNVKLEIAPKVIITVQRSVITAKIAEEIKTEQK